MNGKYLLKNGTIVNDGNSVTSDLKIQNGRISKIGFGLSAEENDTVVDCGGLHILPGVIDDQVHFREPGLTHKGNIYSESRAAIAGGVTSFMEMPNTKPTTTTKQNLTNKLASAKGKSWANYSFFFGATNENFEEVVSVDPLQVAGIKIFMGSSTGNMLVDDSSVLEKIFASTPLVIATHCEDEQTIKNNFETAKQQFGDIIPFNQHPIIRSREACLISSSLAIDLAKKYGSNLHVLHITTAEELAQFEAGSMLNKKITAEVCVHHLWFDDADYEQLGGLIKCNPAIKKASDQEALWKALYEDRIDIIATDHAPHTWEEKQNLYEKCPAGLPLVQHGLEMMLHKVNQNKITIEKVVEKMCHRPADRFQVFERGYLREGYMADIALVDIQKQNQIQKQNIFYLCGWTPLDGIFLKGKNIRTFVNGHLVFENGIVLNQPLGIQLIFNR